MNKEEFVKTLNNVKLVIGNGFDLHCGLHTSYSDYYCKYIEKFLHINKLFDDYVESDLLELKDFELNNCTIWDVFFAFNSSKDIKQNIKKWCDIEALMLSSFNLNAASKPTSELLTNWLISKVQWYSISQHISKLTTPTNHMDRFIVEFSKQKMTFKNIRSNQFYPFLLDELKDFENEFGVFINSQIHQTYLENTNRKEFLHKPYIEMALDTIKNLCDLNRLVSIDSFNYGEISSPAISSKLQHINGNVDAPIFGVDSIYEPKDERFIFTKTSRRIDSDIIDNHFEPKLDFENVVIFGHSLNQADYSYFFPLFDRLKLTDSTAKNVVVFAYSVFLEENEETIKSNLRESISKILYSYALNKGLPNPSRFLDSLSTQKRVLIYEIYPLRREFYGYDHVDDEWNKIYKKAEELAKTN